MIEQRLLRVLLAANLPVVGVSVGDVRDRRTWRVDFMDAATPGERAAATGIAAAFDPADPSLVAAELTVAARALASSQSIRAFYVFWFRKTHERDPTDDERAADALALEQAYRDVAMEDAQRGADR